MMNGGGKNVKETTMVELSVDIVTEILSRLPVKSLLKFKTVCKSWYSIIDSAMFIREHLKQAHAARHNQHKDFLGILIPYWEAPCLLFKEVSEGVIQAEKFDFPVKNLLCNRQADIPQARNLCDGLICFKVECPNAVVIWNPSLPTDYNVIDTSCFGGSYGLGYDPSTEDYMIVGFPFNPVVGAYVSVHVFSLKRDSWRTLSFTKTMDFKIGPSERMVYVRNRLCWYAFELHFIDDIDDDDYVDDDIDYKIEVETPIIVYFDLVEESVGYLNFPSQCDWYVVLMNYKESLGTASCNGRGEAEFWVLQDDCGMNSTWIKMLKISCSRLPESTYHFCFTVRGEILVSYTKGLAIMDAKDGSWKDVECEGECLSDYGKNRVLSIFTWSHVESLVSPARLH